MSEPESHEGDAGQGVWSPGTDQAQPEALAPPLPPPLPFPQDALPSALAPPPVQAPVAEAPAKASSIKPLLLICALSVASAAICGAVIVYVQRGGFSSGAPAASPSASAASGGGETKAVPGEPLPPVVAGADPGASPAPAPSPAPPSGDGKALRATVILPQGQPRAVLRSKPAFKGDMVMFLQPGTTVEIINSTNGEAGTWFRVRTVDTQPVGTGWVHGAVLKM